MLTPVILIIFNRPEATRKVFEEIRKAIPSKLLVIADGPRPEHLGDAEKCAEARAIIDQVNWPCDVLKNYFDINLGCKKRVSSGLDWAFSIVEEAIILEDDCLPHPTFFRFCEELLARYRDDQRIAQIGGTNVQLGRKWSDNSYYFSRYSHIWGWATWRRAWKHYDVAMSLWPEFRNSPKFQKMFRDRRALRFWEESFDKVHLGFINTWDHQWTHACWFNDQLSIIPTVNLISNIGFNEQATHTKYTDNELAELPLEEMAFPIIHPANVGRNRHADDFTQNTILGTGIRCLLIKRIRNVINLFTKLKFA